MCCQGKREPLYRNIWVRAMDDMAAKLVFRAGDLRFLGGSFQCAAPQAHMVACRVVLGAQAEWIAEAG